MALSSESTEDVSLPEEVALGAAAAAIRRGGASAWGEGRRHKRQNVCGSCIFFILNAMKQEMALTIPQRQFI